MRMLLTHIWSTYHHCQLELSVRILCDTSQVNAMAVANSALAYVTDFKAKAASGIRICSGWVLNADGCLAWMRTSGVFVTGG